MTDATAAQGPKVGDVAESPPVLDAYRDDGQLKVWCDHEQRWHTHGGCWSPDCPRTQALLASRYTDRSCTCPPGTGNGHRCAHCGCPHSPYDLTGYTLREVGPFTAAVRKAHGRESKQTYKNCPGDSCRTRREEAAERRWRFMYGQDVLSVACPKCGADVDQRCVISRGHVHSARYNAAMRGGSR